jgi:hypothetical protein
MKKFFVCTLLMTARLFPGAFAHGALVHVGPVLPSQPISNYTLSPNLSHVKSHPIPETSLVINGLEYTVVDDEQTCWQKNQKVIVETCNSKDLAAKDIAVLLSSDSKSGVISLFGGLFALSVDAYRVYQETKLEDVGICPLVHESLDSYITRMRHFCLQGSDVELKTSDLKQDAFRGITWSVLRYLLAMNIELGFLDKDEEFHDETFYFEGTSLDLALDFHDSEMFFWLWKHGARNMRFSKEDLRLRMLRSFDEESVAVLKDLQDVPYSDTWLTSEWATDLKPELVRKKVRAILEISDENDQAALKHCIPWSLARNIPGDTPGAKALRDYVVSRSAWLDCKCAIL